MKTIFSVRFAENCAHINTQNWKNDVIHLRRAKKSRHFRFTFTISWPSRRAASLCYITAAYLCVRKKNTCTYNALIHTRSFVPSCIAPLRCAFTWESARFKATTYVKNKPWYFFRNYQWFLMTLYIVSTLKRFVTLYVAYPFHTSTILMMPYKDCRFRNVIKKRQ